MELVANLEIVILDDPDKNNWVKLLNYCIAIGPGQLIFFFIALSVPVHIVWKFGEGVPAQVSSFSIQHGSNSTSVAAVLLYMRR
ncbi:hypothetical protein TNCV_1566971 [Trichonephila clavipes]|nr:hypothetical protein TNCV_1566971 [Trichonephila clavipes]